MLKSWRWNQKMGRIICINRLGPTWPKKNTCSLPKVWTLMNTSTMVNCIVSGWSVVMGSSHLPFPCCPSSQIQTVAVFVVPHVPVALAHAWRLTLQLNHSQNHTFHQMVSGTKTWCHLYSKSKRYSNTTWSLRYTTWLDLCPYHCITCSSALNILVEVHHCIWT